jgi:shikimate dehydrogenase
LLVCGAHAYNRRVSEIFATPISATTGYCAVLGHPIQHSASPAMQNAGIAALGLNWRYLAFDVPPDELRQTLAGAKAMRFIGLNLTVPHKLLAMEMVEALDESARTWGAVNTIRFEGRDDAGHWRPVGQWQAEAPGIADAPSPRNPNDVRGRLEPEAIRAHGFNTDADAITRSLREDLQLKIDGAKVLLLGAGGAGRTAALKLAAEGVGELSLVNRTTSKAEGVANEIRQRWPKVRVTVGYPHRAVELVLNATSLGLKREDPLPFDERRFSLRQAGAVYDMIYRPAETKFLREAKAVGCRTANGLGMLLYQGAKALELWSGREPPIAVMREALIANVYGKTETTHG